MKNFILLVSFIIILTSCNSLKEAGKVIRNEKTMSTDEFLVKKKQPLIYPPDYNALPSPKSAKEKKQSEEDEIKKILKAPKKEDQKNNKTTSTEKSILENIRK